MQGPLWQPISTRPGFELAYVDKDGFSARVKQPDGREGIVHSTLPLGFPDDGDANSSRNPSTSA